MKDAAAAAQILTGLVTCHACLGNQWHFCGWDQGLDVWDVRLWRCSACGLCLRESGLAGRALPAVRVLVQGGDLVELSFEDQGLEW
jgi:hypothetical protein